jgi:aminoglycoside phosphotransferase (APT) family kinase protein
MAIEQWHPDIEVTEDLVSIAIEDQFPDLAPIKTIKCIGAGWDNKAFLVNNQIVFRFPHRQIAVALIERENCVLKKLNLIINQEKTNIKIPNPLYIGMPSVIYPYMFHGYHIIKGVSGCHAGLTMQERIASLRPLALFLKQLHAITEKQAIVFGGKLQLYDRTKVDSVVAALDERVDKIVDRKIVGINKALYQAEMQKGKKIKLPIDDKVLVHGDLYCRHMMFNQGMLTGIIDWGDVGINNRAVDLAVIFSFYPEDTYKIFFDIYGEVDSHTWAYARFLGLNSALLVMLYAHDIGDVLLVKEAINAIKRINPELILN